MACAVFGQLPQQSSVRGEVKGNIPEDARIELRSCAGTGQDTNVAHTTASGAFEFRGVAGLLSSVWRRSSWPMWPAENADLAIPRLYW